MKLILIENVLNFFIDNKIHRHFSGSSDFICRYTKLKRLLQEFEANEVISDSIIYSLYLYIKKESVPFELFIDSKDILSFLSNHQSFVKEYNEKHSGFVNKLTQFVFTNTHFVKNREELVPYLMVEAMLELSHVRSSFIQKLYNEKENDNVYLHPKLIKISNYNNIIQEMADKPLGLYLTEDFPQKSVNFLTGNGYMLIANKSDGIYIYQFKNETNHYAGFRGKHLQFDNIISRRHEIEVELVETNDTELSTHVEEKFVNFRSFVNELVLNTFIYLSTLNEKQVKENNVAAIGYHKNEDSNVCNFPVLAGFNSTTMPIFTKEELRFKGEFEFLAFLDEWLEPYLDMDSVNYYSDQVTAFHQVSFTHHPNSHRFSATKESLNSFEVKVVTEDFDERTNYTLTPINPYYFGNEQEIYDYAFKIAKANKLKLYSIYMDLLSVIHEYKMGRELHSFFNKNIVEIMNDETFINMINSVGTANISNRNKGYLTSNFNNTLPVFIHEQFIDCSLHISEKAKDGDIDFSNTQFDSIGFKDFIKKTKATKMVVTHCDTMEMLNYLRENYNFVLGEEYETFIKLTKAFKQFVDLRKQNIPEKTKLHNLTMMHDSPFEAEYHYGWLKNFIPFALAIPMNKNNEKLFMEKFMLNNVKITNCNFGYSNNSHNYYINFEQPL